MSSPTGAFRLLLVRERSSLKHRVHAQLLAFGHTCPVSDLFGRSGRELLERLEFPEPWRSGVLAAVSMIDDPDVQITAIDREIKALGADHEYVALLMSAPGDRVGARLHDRGGDRRHRVLSLAVEAVWLHGLCPRVYQSGERDHRGSIAKNGPKYLRWALIEAATHAVCSPVYRERYQPTAKRLGRQRARKIARVDIARKLAEAIWYMLTRKQTFAPAGATAPLAA